jgi:hypothetical protein
MQSFHQSRFYSFRADANAVGGFLEEPICRNVPTVAPVSLPPVGGFATARSEGFNLEEIISFSAAYTRATGVEHGDGSISILSTAVVEKLNLLEVVTAERIVAQVSIAIASGSSELRVSLAGSRFEGLRLAGRRCEARLNPLLSQVGPPQAGRILPLGLADFEVSGRTQANGVIKGIGARGDKDADLWAKKRHGWMTPTPVPEHLGLLASLVDGLDGKDAPPSVGHIVEIPGFGRIYLGELRVTRDSVQLVAIRAELGCPVKGKITICSGGGGGGGDKS